MELIHIKKRKIQARQFSQTDEGKVYWETKNGHERAQDGDWLIPNGNGTYTIINKDAMEFLTTKDDDKSET